MKKLLPVFLATLMVSAPAVAENFQAEKLVLNATATRVDLNIQFRKGVEIQNLGPNAIYCVVNSSTVTLTKARKLEVGEPWSMWLAPGVPIYCKAVTADQVTGAATIVTEVR